MRAHRGKQVDWNRPFKTVYSKSEFDSMETGDSDLVVSLGAKQDANPPPIAKKEEIIVPKIQIVKRITSPKKFAKIQPNYIRITERLNLPKLMSYELNEVDHVFLQGQASKYKFNGKAIITPQFLSAAFIELESKAGKDHVLPRAKTWMTQYIERQHKQLLAIPNVDQMAEVFYNYWKNRRQELKFPMLRSLWRPNPQQYNHLLAFKPREKDKRSLRRTSRIAQDEIVQDLEDQFSIAVNIAERIKTREELKLKQVQLNLTNFHNECKNYFPESCQQNLFFTPFEPESRVRDKQKLRSLQQETERIKREQFEEEKQQQYELIAQQQTYDQKKSIVNFLATIVSYSDSEGISYDKIFHDRMAPPHYKTPSLPLANNSSSGPETSIMLPSLIEKPQCLQIGLYRDKQMIYRVLDDKQFEVDDLSDNSLEEEDENKNQEDIKAPKTLDEYYVENLKCYSFGEQDEGDYRDLRKITSQGFKKFQNMMRS